MESQGGGGKGGSSGPRRAAGGGGTSQVSMPCVMKFLAPEVLAAAVIGKGGTVIAAIRQAAQAKIALTEPGEYYPHSDCRVITVQGNTEDALVEVASKIVAKTAECVATAGSESLGQDGDLRLKTPVPRAAVGGIIGKGGAAIKQLREASGAKISISDAAGAGPSAEQVVSLSGTSEAIETVLTEIIKQVQALNQEPWFLPWASATGISDRYGGGKGGGGNGASWGGSGMDSGSYSGSSYGGGGAANLPAGMDMMMRVAQGMPPYVLEDSRGFALSCVVPNRLVGGLIGRGGAGTKEVQNLTGTKIGIREIPGDNENRSMNIAGPLGNTCAAYMLMMKRYLDAEAQSAAAAGSGGAAASGGADSRRR